MGTIRLQSIRDGNEDYDLLWQLENELYAQRGVTGEEFESVLQYLVKDLFSGTKCSADPGINAVFAETRSRLAELIVLADKTGTVIENAVTSSGQTVFTISTEEDVTLRVNGSVLTGGQTENGIKVYSVPVALEQDINTLELIAEKDGTPYSLKLSLGGRMTESDFASFEENVSLRTEGAEKSAETMIGTVWLSPETGTACS